MPPARTSSCRIDAERLLRTARGLSPLERFALYEAWGKRCAWGKEPIQCNAFEVDHVIPKSLSGQALDRVLADYGLSASFDLYALQNLVPSCRICNAAKGRRPMPSAPILLDVLAKARERVPWIRRRVEELEGDRAMSEVLTILQGARLTPSQLKSILERVEDTERKYFAAIFHEPLPPKLKRSKNRLGYDGLSDKQQMLVLLESWVRSNDHQALDVVQEAFDGGDTPPQHVWPIYVNFLAYAKEMGDFLASVTFNVDYLYITDDYSGGANTDHKIDLWITLDRTGRKIVDVVVDHFDTLDACDGYRR